MSGWQSGIGICPIIQGWLVLWVRFPLEVTLVFADFETLWCQFCTKMPEMSDLWVFFGKTQLLVSLRLWIPHLLPAWIVETFCKTPILQDLIPLIVKFLHYRKMCETIAQFFFHISDNSSFFLVTIVDSLQSQLLSRIVLVKTALLLFSSQTDNYATPNLRVAIWKEEKRIVQSVNNLLWSWLHQTDR